MLKLYSTQLKKKKIKIMVSTCNSLFSLSLQLISLIQKYQQKQTSFENYTKDSHGTFNRTIEKVEVIKTYYNIRG